jgi:hypothetical protein
MRNWTRKRRPRAAPPCRWRRADLAIRTVSVVYDGAMTTTTTRKRPPRAIADNWVLPAWATKYLLSIGATITGKRPWGKRAMLNGQDIPAPYARELYSVADLAIVTGETQRKVIERIRRWAGRDDIAGTLETPASDALILELASKDVDEQASPPVDG